MAVAHQQLQRIYRTKCSDIGLIPTPEILRRLSRVDAGQSRTLDLSGIACDATFRCVIDVLVVATAINCIDFSGTQLTNALLDDLVHCLSKAVGIRKVRLCDNPALTDHGAAVLLDLFAHGTTVTHIDVSGCAFSPRSEAQLSEAAAKNVSPQRTPMQSPGDSDDDGAHDSNAHLLNSTRRIDTLSFHRQPTDSLAPPSPTYSGVVPAKRRVDDVGFDDEFLGVIRELSLALVGFLRVGFAVFMWQSAMRSLVMLAVCVSVVGMPLADSRGEGWAFYNALLLGSLWLVQQRIKRPRSEIALSSVTRSDELWQQREPPRLLLWVVNTEQNLASDSSKDVIEAVKDVVNGIHCTYVWAVGPARLMLAASLFVAFLLALADVLEALLFLCVCGFFAYTPIRMAVSRVKALVSKVGHPFSPQKQPLQTLDDFEPFEFHVTLKQLQDVSLKHFSVFVPFVQVKHNRAMWLFPKVQQHPYAWNLTSKTRFQAAAGGNKLLITVYDDSAEVAEPCLQGFVIVDECTPLNQDIVVPLQAARTESSLVRVLLEEVQNHDVQARSRYLKSRKSAIAGGVAQHGAKGSVSIQNPGSVVIQINPVGHPVHVQPQIDRRTSQGEKVEIAVEPASPALEHLRNVSPPLSGMTPRRTRDASLRSSENSTSRDRGPSLSRLGDGRQSNPRPESLYDTGSSVGGRTSTARSFGSNTGPPTGPVVYRSSGSVAT